MEMVVPLEPRHQQGYRGIGDNTLGGIVEGIAGNFHCRIPDIDNIAIPQRYIRTLPGLYARYIHFHNRYLPARLSPHDPHVMFIRRDTAYHPKRRPRR